MSALRTFTRSYSSSPNIFKHIEKIASVIRALVDTRPFFPPLHDPCTSLSTTCPSTLSEPRLPRNWIVILFSKAICKCYQKVSSRHALPPSPPLSLSLFLSLSLNPFFFYSSELLRVSPFNIFAPPLLFNRLHDQINVLFLFPRKCVYFHNCEKFNFFIRRSIEQ